MYYYSMTGKDVIKKLECAGWKLKRVKGSHHIMELGSVLIPFIRSNPRTRNGGKDDRRKNRLNPFHQVKSQNAAVKKNGPFSKS